MTTVQGLPWDDPRLRESADTNWAAGCRALQTWWRQEHLGLAEYGPHRQGDPNRLVGSMLPLNAAADANFLNSGVLVEVGARLAQKGWGGLVSEDRLRRNLLSSQPLAFNLFGYLKHHPRALLAWLAALGVDATEIVEVRIEWAPSPASHFGGGSAFDAAVFYRTGSGEIGLIGVECKYAEDLNAQRIDPRPPYLKATRGSGHWRPSAVEVLREPRLVQLWLNTLLAQSCVAHGEERVSEALVVVMACAADEHALSVTVATRAELLEPARWLTWCPYEGLLDAVSSFDDVADWSARFRTRYLDFDPVLSVFDVDDARCTGAARRVRGDPLAAQRLRADVDAARAVTERVLGDAGFLEDLAFGDVGATPTVELLTVARRVAEASEALRQIRAVAGPAATTVVSTESPHVELSTGEVVAHHCLAVLGDPEQWRPGGGYESMALCVMDAIWSIGIRYERVVGPLLDRYRAHRAAQGADPAVDSLDDLVAAIDEAGGPQGFAATVVRNHNRTSSRSGVLKAEAVRDAAAALLALGLSTVDDMRKAPADVRVAADKAWRAVHGQRSGISWEYLLMLLGEDRVKPDRMIRRFVAAALGHGPDESRVGAGEADQALRDAWTVLRRDRPDLTLRTLDRTIWGYQSGSGPAQ